MSILAAKQQIYMNRPLLILMVICFANIDYAFAQWDKKDSVWLQDILSGKEKLKLNPDVLKAIKDGSLINNDSPATHMKMATPDAKLPISKDFAEYIHADSSNRKIALKDLPTQVFWQYSPKKEKMLPVLQSIMDELKRNPLRGVQATTFDMAGMTSRKTYVHARNVKRDGTWKNYNNLPTPDIIKKRKKFEETVTAKLKKDSITQFKDSLCLVKDSTYPLSPAPQAPFVF